MKSSDTQIIGHRGWPTRHPDNTLGGMAAAMAVVGMVETDVRRCADGRLVLSHDPVLGGLPVSETRWEELSRLDLGGGNRPLLLDTLLAALPGGRIDLEVKNEPGEPGFEPDFAIAHEVAALARPVDLVSSFHWPNLDAIRRTHPTVATGLLLEEGEEIDHAIEHARSHGHGAVIPRWTMIETDPSAVERAHAAGLTVITWTVNDPDRAGRMAALGVGGIVTDDPMLIARALEEKS